MADDKKEEKKDGDKGGDKTPTPKQPESPKKSDDKVSTETKAKLKTAEENFCQIRNPKNNSGKDAIKAAALTYGTAAITAKNYNHADVAYWAALNHGASAVEVTPLRDFLNAKPSFFQRLKGKK